MLEKDIDTYCRAKRTQIIADFFAISAGLTFIGVLFIVTNQAENASLAVTSLCFGSIFIGFATGWHKNYFILGRNWTPVSKQELLPVLERQINDDADAITYLSDQQLSR